MARAQRARCRLPGARWCTALAFAAALLLAPGCSTNRSLTSTDGLSDWLEVRGGPARDGGTLAKEISPPLYLAWREHAGRSPAAEPSLAGDVILIASTDRQLRLLETGTGATVWKRKLDGIPSTNVCVSAERAFVGHLKPQPALLAIDVVDGSIAWRRTEIRPTGGQVVRGDTLFVWDLGRGPTALSVEDGEVLWRAELPERWPAPLAHARGMLIVATERDSLRALSSRDGTRLWATSMPDGARGAPAIAAGRVVVPGTLGTVRALEVATGEPIWTRRLPARLASAVCIVDGEAYVGAANGRLYALDLSNGETTWTVDLDGVCQASPAAAGDVLVVVTMSGTCQLVSRVERRVVHTVDLRAPVRVAPVVRGDRLFTVDDGGNVYAYESS